MQEISKLITEIRDVLIDAGLNASSIAFKANKLEKSTEAQQDFSRRWLVAFRDVYVAKYKKAKSLVGEDIWRMYKASGIKGTYEQKELDMARKMLIAEWRNRPENLNRKPNVQKESGKKGKGARASSN